MNLPFRRRGAFPWIVILMLALGVGATTAMFSVVNGVLLQPLDFHDPGQLVLVGERVPQIPGSEKFSYFDTPSAFLAWQKNATDFIGLSALQSNSFTLAGEGRPRLLHGAKVSSNFFDVVGVRAELGRLFVPADETDTSTPMVITDAVWRSAYNADPTVIGRVVGASGRQATVIGVLPANFRLGGAELGPMTTGSPTEYFVPLHFGPEMGGDLTAVFSNFNYTVIGRLKAGVTLPHALAQLNVIQADLARSAPEKLALDARLTTVRDYAVADARQVLWLLFAGVAAVLLIVCVNLGGLWTTRLADSRREWAIRSALGAAPGQLVRQILGESVVLALAGGVLGIACTALTLQTLVALAPAGIPRLDEVHLDWRVLVFGLLLAVVAGLLTGVVPALRLSHADPQSSLKAGAASVTADRASLRSRKALIGVQAALSTVLLAAAGLLGVSFYHLISRPTGFSAERTLAADVVINTYTDAQRDHVLSQLPAAISQVPGVTSAAFTSHLPLEGETWIDSAGVPGRVYTAAEKPHVNVRFVSPGYFRTIGIPLLAGRDLAESDRPAGWPPKSPEDEAKMNEAVVISQATAKALWPGDDPRSIVGRKMLMNGQNPTVVGVAADALDGSLTTAPPSVVYQPYWENPPYSLSVVVRSTLPAASLAGPLRDAIWKLAPDAPIPRLRSLAEFTSTVVAPQRYQLTLLLLFAGLALFLAAMGVYALVTHEVAGRRKELALRIAIGASGGHLWALVLRQALAPVAWGVLAGVVAALATGRVLESLLFEIRPSNPAVLITVALVVLLAAAAACLLPARRATRTDPTSALRAE
ncbi:MAG TPA: ABC transporter permease [Vicinamibacterales bacterium]|jgi:putative ABC transport system permease protein